MRRKLTILRHQLPDPDYSHARMILEPNKLFSEPFDRAFAGLAVRTEDKDYSTFRVTEILENSPASEAGLQKDDSIIKIDDRPNTQLTLTKLNELFEQPKRYKVTLRRGDFDAEKADLRVEKRI